MFYPPFLHFSPIWARILIPREICYIFRRLKVDFDFADVEKNDDLVSVTTFSEFFEVFWCFSMLLPYFSFVLSFPNAFNMFF